MLLNEMIKLYNEDCLGLNGMCKIDYKSIDMVLADLPYQITANQWDKALPFDEGFKEYNRVIKDNGAIVLFGSQPFSTDLINSNRKFFRYELIWSKNYGTNFMNANRMPLKTHENILVFYKQLPTYNLQKVVGKPYKMRERKCFNSHLGCVKNVEEEHLNETTILRHPKSVLNFKKEQGKHTTQKPVGLLEWLIKTYTNPNELILDNCMGSGSTGVACIKTDRSFIGYELDEGYYMIAVKRIKEAELERTERAERTERTDKSL
jgi:site-specific DNA-methyltransferase (adenine-specific)